jgi:hypothetical protein
MTIFPARAAAAFISEENPDIYITASWLNPLLKANLTKPEDKFILTVYLFNSKVLTKSFHKDTSKLGRPLKDLNHYMNLMRTLRVEGIKLYATYGFTDPSITGMLFGTIDIVAQTFSFQDYYNNADFFSDNNYFNITAKARLNLTNFTLQLLRDKLFYSQNYTIIGLVKK